MGPSFVVTGNTDEELHASSVATRQQIAFYGSTPAYLPVLEMHGWGELHHELNALSKQGKWVEMGTLIPDDVLDAFAVVGPPEAVGTEILRRYGDVIQRFSLYAPYRGDPQRWAALFRQLRAG